MLSNKAFVISNQDGERDFDATADLALSLDPVDFSTDGYFVDQTRYPRLGIALSKGKAVAHGDGEEGEDDAINAQSASPSTSTVVLDDEELGDEAVPMEHGSPRNSSAPSETGEGVRRLEFRELEGLNLKERP